MDGTTGDGVRAHGFFRWWFDLGAAGAQASVMWRPVKEAKGRYGQPRYRGELGRCDGVATASGEWRAMAGRGVGAARMRYGWLASLVGSWSTHLLGIEPSGMDEVAEPTAWADAWPIGRGDLGGMTDDVLAGVGRDWLLA